MCGALQCLGIQEAYNLLICFNTNPKVAECMGRKVSTSITPAGILSLKDAIDKRLCLGGSEHAMVLDPEPGVELGVANETQECMRSYCTCMALVDRKDR